MTTLSAGGRFKGAFGGLFRGGFSEIQVKGRTLTPRTPHPHKNCLSKFAQNLYACTTCELIVARAIRNATHANRFA